MGVDFCAKTTTIHGTNSRNSLSAVVPRGAMASRQASGSRPPS